MRLKAWKSANGTNEFWLIQEFLNRFAEFVAEGLSVPGEEARHSVAFEMLPEAFDRIEIRAVGRQEHFLDMMPFQPFGFMPAGIV